MNKREVEILEAPQHVAMAAADEFVRLAREATQRRNRFTVALAGGSTPTRMYRFLASDAYRQQVNWPGVHFFWSDERAVPPDDPNNNYRLAWTELIAKTNARPEQIHRIPAERGNETAAIEYEFTLKSFVSASPTSLPVFDLIYLGIGLDGHTASLFPKTSALHETRRWVMPTTAPAPPERRVTFTFPVLNCARQIILMVTGEEKRDVLAASLDDRNSVDSHPVRGLQPTDGNLTFLIDQAAADPAPP